VDLRYAKKNNNWKRKGYLNKIYTRAELELINKSADANKMVWLLWSMKEASYKANHRITHVKEYTPNKIECEINFIKDDLYYGKTIYNGREYNLKVTVFAEYIHSVALYQQNIFSDVKEITVRNYTTTYVDYLKKSSFISKDEVIKKDEFGIPNLINDAKNETKPISISHHGIFLNVIFLKNGI
jgi:phosphopantetheinyl transferase (holo-ACP synthase)